MGVGGSPQAPSSLAPQVLKLENRKKSLNMHNLPIYFSLNGLSTTVPPNTKPYYLYLWSWHLILKTLCFTCSSSRRLAIAIITIFEAKLSLLRSIIPLAREKTSTRGCSLYVIWRELHEWVLKIFQKASHLLFSGLRLPSLLFGRVQMMAQVIITWWRGLLRICTVSSPQP